MTGEEDTESFIVSTARCEIGDSVLSGGFIWRNPQGEHDRVVSIKFVNPVIDQEGWVVEVTHRDPFSSRIVRAFATCFDNP